MNHAQLSSLCADLDLSCPNVCAGVPALVGVGHSYQSWQCRQLEQPETQTFVVALGDRKNNRKQRNEALTSFVSPLFPQKDNLSISLIHPQASSHTFCLKRQVLTNFRAFFSSKLSNEILLKEKKRKIIGAVAQCGTWLAGQGVPVREGRQPQQPSQPWRARSSPSQLTRLALLASLSVRAQEPTQE